MPSVTVGLEISGTNLVRTVVCNVVQSVDHALHCKGSNLITNRNIFENKRIQEYLYWGEGTNLRQERRYEMRRASTLVGGETKYQIIQNLETDRDRQTGRDRQGETDMERQTGTDRQGETDRD